MCQGFEIGEEIKVFLDESDELKKYLVIINNELLHVLILRLTGLSERVCAGYMIKVMLYTTIPKALRVSVQSV